MEGYRISNILHCKAVETAVNNGNSAGDKLCGVGHQIVDGAAEFLGLAHATEGSLTYHILSALGEDILRDSVSAYSEIRGIALRYFNPVGAHPSALIGELPRGVPNNLVPFITQTAIGIRECLSVFGNDYPTPDGTCQRDFIDIVDLAKAHVFAVRRMLDGKMKKEYEIFNIGTGKPLSVMELINAFEKANNLKLNYKFAPRRAGDVTAIWADPTLANNELGWKAERSIEDTLTAAWAWEKHLAGK